MRRPNIILIVSDEHRGDWMGCAGSTLVNTPHIDRMARDGVQFRAAYCNAPLCVPSRMSLLTGTLPHHTDVFTNADYLGSDRPTFAHALARAGYDTVLCGRMHFNGADQRHGFATRLVGDITPSYPGGPATEYGPLKGTAGQGMRSVLLAGPGNSPVIEYDLRVAAAAQEFMRERAQAAGGGGQEGQDRRDLRAAEQRGARGHTDGPETALDFGPGDLREVEHGDRPLFLTVGFYGPHHPYVAPPRMYAQAKAAMATAEPPERAGKDMHPWLRDWFTRTHADQLSDDQIREARTNYAGLVNQLDELVGRVVESARQLPGDTVVVYLSDHGDMAGDNGMFWKRSMFEGATRVPLIWCPLKQDGLPVPMARGRVVEEPVSLVDIAPTLVSLGGAPELPYQDGLDLSGLLTAEMDPGLVPALAGRPVFAELAGIADGAVRMVRKGNFKLISYHGHERAQLFDVDRDPGEREDLASDPRYADVYRELLTDVSRDWDPDAVMAALAHRQRDQSYMAAWGGEVGMGRVDLWDEVPVGEDPARG